MQVLTVFLAILAFLFGFASFAVADLSEAISEDGLEEFFEKTQLSTLDLSAFTGKEGDLAEVFAKELAAVTQDKYKPSRKEVAKFLDRSTFPAFITEKAGDLIEAVTDGEKAEITQADILNLLKSNATILLEDTGVKLSDSYYEKLAKWFYESAGLENLNAAQLRKAQPLVYYGIAIGLSEVTAIVLGLLSLIFAALILLIHKKALLSGIGKLSVVYLTLGGLTSLMCFVAFLLGLFLHNNVIFVVLSVVLTEGAVAALAILGLGLALLITWLVWRAILKAQEKKAALAV